MLWTPVRRNRTVMMIGMVAVVITICLSWFGWGWIREGWDWLRTGAEGETHSVTLRNLALAGALPLGIVGVFLAAWRSWTVHKQTEAITKQVEVASRQAETAERGLQNERYQRGEDMLGSETLQRRLDGIRTLRRLAQDHPEEYHIQVMDLFSDFVRHPVSAKDLDLAQGKVRADVQEIMRTFGRRSPGQIALGEPQNYWIDLTDAKLPGVRLPGANLNKVFLSGADLTAADLNGTNLTQAALNGANLTGADLTGADLSGVNLSGVNLTGAELIGANLSGANLSEVNLAGTNFLWADLTGADFFGVDLTGTNFLWADLTGARFQGGDLEKATFNAVNLTGADLRFAVGLMQTHLDTAAQHPAGAPPSLPNDYAWSEEEAKARWRQLSNHRNRATT